MQLLFEGGSYFFELALSTATIRGAAIIQVNMVLEMAILFYCVTAPPTVGHFPQQ